MNLNDARFDGHITALRNNLIEALKNNSSQVFAHLSHDDLDGYGCTVITYLQQWYLQKNMDGIEIPHIVTPNFLMKNTNKLNRDVYPVLDELMYEAAATTYHRRINLLITDLGGIDVKELINRYRNFNAADVHIMIVDHHRSEYQSQHATTLDYKGGRITILHDAEDNTVVSYRDGSLFQLDMYITNGKISATKALHNILKQGTEPEEMDHFSDAVSLYDTGNVGNWRIPEEEYDNIQYMKEHVSEQVLLNCWWKSAYQAVRTHPSALLKFIVEVGARIAVGYTNCEMHDAIYDRIVLINQQYKIFCENLEVITRIPGRDLLYGKGKTLRIPECAEHVKSFAIYWHDNPEEIYPPLTMYSKVYLADHPEVDVLMVANEIRHSVDTRSMKDEINVYDICVANGGGGHPHAAGCPMK